MSDTIVFVKECTLTGEIFKMRCQRVWIFEGLFETFILKNNNKDVMDWWERGSFRRYRLPSNGDGKQEGYRHGPAKPRTPSHRCLLLSFSCRCVAIPYDSLMGLVFL